MLDWQKIGRRIHIPKQMKFIGIAMKTINCLRERLLVSLYRYSASGFQQLFY